MNQKELIELIKQHHTDMGITEIRAKLNRAQDDFCARTEVIKRTYVQNTEAGTRYYPLDANILKITKVQLDDIYIPRLIGDPIIDDDEFDLAEGRNDVGTGSTDWYWYISNNRIGIVEKVVNGITVNGKTSHYISVSTVKQLRLFTISQATDFTTLMNFIPDLPPQFREALSFKVIADGYLRGETLSPDLHTLFMKKYELMVRDGRKYSRSNFQQDAILKPQDF